jgi:hypothetical protein
MTQRGRGTGGYTGLGRVPFDSYGQKKGRKTRRQKKKIRDDLRPIQTPQHYYPIWVVVLSRVCMFPPVHKNIKACAKRSQACRNTYHYEQLRKYVHRTFLFRLPSGTYCKPFRWTILSEGLITPLARSQTGNGSWNRAYNLAHHNESFPAD